MSLDGSNGEALNTSHSHSESEKLKRKGLPCAARSDNIEIRILMLSGIKKVNHTQRIVVLVDTQKNA